MLSYHVKFVQTDRWTEGQTDNGKTICPPSFDTGAWKFRIERGMIKWHSSILKILENNETLNVVDAETSSAWIVWKT